MCVHLPLTSPGLLVVRIVSARVGFVCVHYFRTPGDARTIFFRVSIFSGFFIFQLFEIDANFRSDTSKVRSKPLKSRQKSKIDHRTKRVLPNARCLGGVAD